MSTPTISPARHDGVCMAAVRGPGLILAAAISPDEIRRRMQSTEANVRHTQRWNLEQPAGERVASLHLYGVVGGFWGDIVAGDVVRAIRAVDADEIRVYINSPGGDVYDGLSIRNALRQHSARVVVTVDGLAASAASFIATVGDEVIMGTGAEIMIHDAWTIALGNADELRVVSDDLDRISDTIAAMYASKAGGTAAEWRALMKAETWYSADEAVTAGLANRTDAATPAAANRFDLSIFTHAGRSDAPAPIPAAALATRPAAQAPHRKDNTLMNRAQLLAALNAGTITQEQYDTALAAFDLIAPTDAVAPSAGTPGEPVPAEYAAGPANSPRPAARVEDRPRSFATVATEIQDAARAQDLRRVVETVNNALETFGVDDDGGAAFYGRPDWIGEVWQAETEGRPFIDSLGGTSPLTSDKVEGFRWVREDETAEWADEDETPAHVEIYEGDFTEVPTGTFKTKKVSAEAEQWGFGMKVDRIFQDLGSVDLIAALFAKLAAIYDKDSDAHVRTAVLTAATAPAGGAATVAGVLPALTAIAFDMKRIGAHLDHIWVAENLFTSFSALKVSDLPAWLANQLGFVNLRTGNATVADGLGFDVDFGLSAGVMVGYDKRAFNVRESSRITLQAIDIAHRATDIGFFSYGGTLTNDPRAIRKRTVTV